jgi:hypothetical protein
MIDNVFYNPNECGNIYDVILKSYCSWNFKCVLGFVKVVEILCGALLMKCYSETLVI